MLSVYSDPSAAETDKQECQADVHVLITLLQKKIQTLGLEKKKSTTHDIL